VSAAVSQQQPFRIRKADASDRAYVLRSWFEGARSTRWARDVGQLFFSEHGKMLESILDRATTRVAHVPGEDAAILGFAVFELKSPFVLHWVHVRRFVRGQGIARALVGDLGDTVHCSHWPSDGRAPANYRYNPYCLLRGVSA
jgi:ribosomal protein S18 acetylase RimI-like enzyme